MPTIKKCPHSGGILFHQTSEERELSDLKKQYKEEIQEIKELKQQLKQQLRKLKGGLSNGENEGSNR